MTTAEPIIREADSADELAVGEICRQIWSETDHLPDYWLRFLNNPATLSRVIEVEGQVAAVAFLDLGDSAAWWHSLRVAPAFQHQGFAVRLLDHFIDQCLLRRIPRLRFAASRDSKPMHRLAAGHGFRLLSRHRYTCAGPPLETDEVWSSVYSLNVSDLDRVETYLYSSQSWRDGHRTACRLWVWEDLTRDSLRSMLEQGTAYACLEDGRIEGLALTFQERESAYAWLFLARIEGSGRGIKALGRHLRCLVSKLKSGSEEECPVQGMVLDDPLIIEALLGAGFRLFPEEDMDLFELTL